ncbi:unnamed protein product [Paramecium octaurelia]|uniref:Uncharacterized protein n=1 Tax=Paramecium octaurelia TaxID=43137 RepID=A0A8S1Y5R0_PAROT|nr:unnamed protein product [Paramecium octaurelia]
MNNSNESISALTECLKSVPIQEIRSNPSIIAALYNKKMGTNITADDVVKKLNSDLKTIEKRIENN